MKFYSDPNLTVMGSAEGVFLCKFNSNGEFETDDEGLIERLKPHFKHDLHNT